MSRLRIYGTLRAQAKREIQQVLDHKGKNFVDVAKLAGVSRQTVSATVNGLYHSSKVLNALRQIGVPEELLHDPRRADSAA